MSIRPVPHLSLDDCLAVERAANDARSEFVDGEVFAMTGGSKEHNLIGTGIVRELGNQFKHRPSNVYSGDMKVRIDAASIGAYPDEVYDKVQRPAAGERR